MLITAQHAQGAKQMSTHLEAGTVRLVHIPRLEVCAPVCDEAPVVVVVF